MLSSYLYHGLLLEKQLDDTVGWLSKAGLVHTQVAIQSLSHAV